MIITDNISVEDFHLCKARWVSARRSRKRLPRESSGRLLKKNINLLPDNLPASIVTIQSLPKQKSQRDNQHGENLPGLEVFVQLCPKVIVDCRDDEVNLEELGG